MLPLPTTDEPPPAAAAPPHSHPLPRSHELRTPLNAITASAALLNDPATGPLNAAQRDLLQMLDTGSCNVVTIVDDILNLHSLTKGSFQVRLEEVDLLRQVVEPAWRMLTMQPALRERLGQLTLSRRLGENLPATIRTDATRAMQIIINVVRAERERRRLAAKHRGRLRIWHFIYCRRRSCAPHRPAAACAHTRRHTLRVMSQLNNAAKFTERGSITLEVDRVTDPTDGVRFRITDTGIGISPENQRIVFDLFTQADSDSSRVFQGTGIGLAIGRRHAPIMPAWIAPSEISACAYSRVRTAAASARRH